MLGGNGAWETSLVLNLGDLAPGSAKRVLIPVRCLGGSGSIAVTAYAENANPAYAVVKVSSKEAGWSPALLPIAAAAALASLYALHRARGERRQARQAPGWERAGALGRSWREETGSSLGRFNTPSAQLEEGVERA
jgi:hypothetical protein